MGTRLVATRLVALLIGLAAAAAPAAAVAAPSGPSGLHDCDTKVDRNVGYGWCYGTGTFRIVVDCADGTSVQSAWVRINSGYGTRGITCHELATKVTIVEPTVEPS